MRFLSAIFIGVFLSGLNACSGKGKLHMAYINGDVRVNGVSASAGFAEGDNFSINTGKESSAVIIYDGDITAALSSETGLNISKGSFKLVSGRIVAAAKDELQIESREVIVEADNSLFEVISRNNVSLVKNYSGEVFVKTVLPGNELRGITLNENFSVESVNGSFSPSQSLGTDVVRKSSPLAELFSFDPSVSLSADCLELINSSYGDDLVRRYSLRAVSSVHGALSEVLTVKGKSIIGAVNVSGSRATVHTVNGDIVMDVSQIKSIRRYAGD